MFFESTCPRPDKYSHTLFTFSFRYSPFNNPPTPSKWLYFLNGPILNRSQSAELVFNHKIHSYTINTENLNTFSFISSAFKVCINWTTLSAAPPKWWPKTSWFRYAEHNPNGFRRQARILGVGFSISPICQIIASIPPLYAKRFTRLTSQP